MDNSVSIVPIVLIVSNGSKLFQIVSKWFQIVTIGFGMFDFFRGKISNKCFDRS